MTFRSSGYVPRAPIIFTYTCSKALNMCLVLTGTSESGRIIGTVQKQFSTESIPWTSKSNWNLADKWGFWCVGRSTLIHFQKLSLGESLSEGGTLRPAWGCNFWLDPWFTVQWVAKTGDWNVPPLRKRKKEYWKSSTHTAFVSHCHSEKHRLDKVQNIRISIFAVLWAESRFDKKTQQKERCVADSAVHVFTLSGVLGIQVMKVRKMSHLVFAFEQPSTLSTLASKAK